MPDENEPYKLARAVGELGLKHAVISSVNRDDLPDKGAGHFAHCIRMVKQMNPKTIIEASIPDFSNNVDSIKKIVNANPAIISHDLDVVKRLTPIAKDGNSNYELSLDVLRQIKRMNPFIITKSSLMVGMRETEIEIYAAMRHLRKSGVTVLTLGQYLPANKKNLKVLEYVRPEQFEKYETMAYRMGFDYVVSSPLARSSYYAGRRFIDPEE